MVDLDLQRMEEDALSRERIRYAPLGIAVLIAGGGVISGGGAFIGAASEAWAGATGALNAVSWAAIQRFPFLIPLAVVSTKVTAGLNESYLPSEYEIIRPLEQTAERGLPGSLAASESAVARIASKAAPLDAAQGVVGTSSTILTAEMESKILLGQRVGSSNRIIGGHSGTISNLNPSYAVEDVATNPNGTRVVKFITQFPDGTLSKIKKSTLFPATWSDAEIIDAVKQVGDSAAVMSQVSNQATVHRMIVNGVEVEVLKIGSNVISAYPTGG